MLPRTRLAFSSSIKHYSTLPPPRLDYRSLSENITSKSLNALNRKSPIPSDTLPSLARTYAEWKRVNVEVNQKRNRRSLLGERIRNDSQQTETLEEAATLKSEVKTLETKLSSLESLLLNLALPIPNDTHPSSPLGPQSAATVLYQSHSSPLADTNRDHLKISTQLSLTDFKSAATTTGHAWYFLQNEGALLELALTNYALSLALKRGYIPLTTPDVVRSDIAYRCGFQPRDSVDQAVSHMYHIAPSSSSPSHELILSGTAEIQLAGTFANKVLPSSSLPVKLVGVSHAFRAEAGARSVETRGLYRVHQFTKVELFVVCGGNDDNGAKGSEEMMEEMLSLQKEVLDGLGLPYRVLDMPSEELGASAYRKYDIEAWMPGRGTWGELTSLSNCTDYQSRRLHIRYRPSPPSSTTTTSPATSTPLPFAHTLNGTAAAIPRLIVALLENGAVFDEGSGALRGVRLPKVLKPFWVGDILGRKDVVLWDED